MSKLVTNVLMISQTIITMTLSHSKTTLCPFYDGEMGYLVSRYVEIYIVTISIIVVAVPEGFPLAVMISLAYSI